MVKLLRSPSLMCGNPLNLEQDIEIIQKYGFEYIHIDITDAHFVPNITLGFDLANKIHEFTTIPLDIHLMMEYPNIAIEKLKVNEKDIITFHIECLEETIDVIQNIKNKGAKIGLAINPNSPLKELTPFLTKIDYALVMTVYPGFSGQPFLKESYQRVQTLISMVNEKSLSVEIGVDGGIGFEQISTFNKLGVDLFVLGTTALFRGNLSEQAVVLSNFTDKLKDSLS